MPPRCEITQEKKYGKNRAAGEKKEVTKARRHGKIGASIGKG
jgi:hypothetical protein